jgi:hypothetical protein
MTRAPLYQRKANTPATTPAEPSQHSTPDTPAQQNRALEQERELQRKMRELGRAEQELQDERQILAQDKLAFERTQVQQARLSKRYSLIVLPLVMIASMAVGYAGASWLATPVVAAGIDDSRLQTLRRYLDRNDTATPTLEQIFAPATVHAPGPPHHMLDQVERETGLLQQLAGSAPAAGSDQSALQQNAALPVDELMAQLSTLKLELTDQHVLMDVDEVYFEAQTQKMKQLAQRLAVREQEMHARDEDYQLLLIANRALVREVNQLRGRLQNQTARR